MARPKTQKSARKKTRVCDARFAVGAARGRGAGELFDAGYFSSAEVVSFARL